MEEKPCAPRDLLLRYLGGDEEKLERYLRLLAACASAFEVADRVVRRVYVEENIPHEVFTKESFYGLFATLAPMMKNGSLKPKTLYYHIAKHLPEWREERGKRRKEMPRNYERAYVPQLFSRNGTVYAIVHFHSDELPEDMLRMLEYCIEKGWATLYEPSKDGEFRHLIPTFGEFASMFPPVSLLKTAWKIAAAVAQKTRTVREKLQQPGEKTVIMHSVPAVEFSQILEKLRGKAQIKEETNGAGQPLVVAEVW